MEKAKRNIVTQDYENGGIKMVNLVAYIKNLKLSWIRRAFKINSKWMYLLKENIDF